MSLPDPCDFRNSNSGCSEGEFTNHDLLHEFHSTEGRRVKGDPVKRIKDRRLDFMRHRCEIDSDDEATESCTTPSKRLDPNSNLKFLGEQLVSDQKPINEPSDETKRLIIKSQVSLLFRRELGECYDPVVCWTSRLRTRAGLPEFHTKTHHGSFTMSDPEIAKSVTRLLYKRGWQSIAQYGQASPTYHFDVGVSAGGLDDTFEWGTSQLRMVRLWNRPSLLP